MPEVKIKEKKKEEEKLISSKAELIKTLRERETVLPRPLRDHILDFASRIGKSLRNPDFWAYLASTEIAASSLYSLLDVLGVGSVTRSERRKNIFR